MMLVMATALVNSHPSVDMSDSRRT